MAGPCYKALSLVRDIDLGTDGVEFRHVKRGDNIKLNLSEILFYDVNWIDLAHKRVQCFAVSFMFFVFPVMTVRYIVS